MFDYLIQNGTLIDGTGAPAAAADVAIKDGKIAAVGDLKDASAGTVLDAAGKYVTPGFIDIHRHADAALFRPHFGELELKQGLTTIVNGNCGLSVTPCGGRFQKEIEAYLTPVTGALPDGADFSSLAAYLRAAKKTPSPIHTAMLAGSGTIRACAAGFGTPELDAAQMAEIHRLIEQELGVRVVGRDDQLKISGEDTPVAYAAKVIQGLIGLSARGESIHEQNVRYLIQLVKSGNEDKIQTLAADVLCVTAKGKPVKAKTVGQKKYVDAIRANTVTLGVGPAGTGKTYLAVAAAVAAFRAKEVNRIILTRPAVEAGERLGFLPGDLQSKVDPYLRPLYDALFEMLGAESYAKYVERGNIEVAPLAYMRGRTLDDSFIILDEAQNTSREQMKMFLTRLGFGSKIVITGDVTQIDLPGDKVSGLKEAMRVLRDVEGIALCRLTDSDVVRHVIVQRIIKAYEEDENRRKAKR